MDKAEAMQMDAMDNAVAQMGLLPAPAQQAAFKVFDILETILLDVDVRTLLTACSRVCKDWRDTIRESNYLQQSLFHKPKDSLPRYPLKCDCQGPFASTINPLLWESFRAVYTMASTRPSDDLATHRFHEAIYWENPYICGTCRFPTGSASHAKIAPTVFGGTDKTPMGPPNSTSGSTRHRAFTRSDASWRNMQVTHPSIYEVKFTWQIGLDSVAGFYRLEEKAQVVRFPEGLKMGQLYDLLYSICFTQPLRDLRQTLMLWDVQDGIENEPEPFKLQITEQYFLDGPCRRCGWDFQPVEGATCHHSSDAARSSTWHMGWMFRSEGFEDGFIDFGTSLNERLRTIEEARYAQFRPFYRR